MSADYFDRYAPADQFDGADDDGEFYDEGYGQASSYYSRPSVHYVNESGMPDDVVYRHFNRGRGAKDIASVIEKWSQSLASTPVNQTLDVFNRSRSLNHEVHPHAIMARCAWAVENDDVLSTLADVTEGLMFQKCRFELIDKDQESFWNQWAADVNLDAKLRQMGREEFKVSQLYVGLWWGRKEYTVKEDAIQEQLKEFERERKKNEREAMVEERERQISLNSTNPDYIPPGEIPEIEDEGPGKGNRKRRKKYKVQVPTAMTIFDPTKVLPVGQTMFGKERFAYIANREETLAFSRVFEGELVDGMVLKLIQEKYVPTAEDKALCGDLGIDYNNLWLFKEDAVFRHTVTKAEYERFAPIRLKSILPILDMKDHLRASDRASLIGNTNFIVVITKGTDKLPAQPAEIANLQEQARVIARLPVLIGDHRLHVEIVAPSVDNTLQDSRWQVLDSRLVFKALATFAPVTQGGNSSGVGVKEMSLVVSNGLQNRRHMLLRTLEAKVFKAIMDKNEKELDEFPSLVFAPKRITLDFNNDIVTAILKLRDRGDISRETTLEELDYDQDTEVLRRGRERAEYDPTFGSQTPFSSPTQNPYGAPAPGGAGGLPAQPPPKPNNLGPSGQPRTEGGRPSGAKDAKPRKQAAKKTAAPK